MKSYGKSAAEELAESNAQVREIVHEIVRFGVTQQQLLQVIKLLALELEDPVMMAEITRIVDVKASAGPAQSRLIVP